MKYNKKKHQKQIEYYRSEANLRRIQDYQLNSQQYLEDQKNYNLYAQVIDKYIIKPFLKMNEDDVKPFKKARIRQGVLSGAFFLADLLTFTLAEALKSPLPSWAVSMIGGVFAGLGAGCLFRAVEAGKEVKEVKNENEKVSTEWDSLKEIPEYVKDFMHINGITIKGAEESSEELTAVKNRADLILPLSDEEWLF